MEPRDPCLGLEEPCFVYPGLYNVILENRDPRSGDWLHWRTIIPSKGRKSHHQKSGPVAGHGTLTTNWLLTFSRICFSLSAMDSPFLFLILFFSKRLQAYILPVARTWQAQTCSRSRQYCHRILKCFTQLQGWDDRSLELELVGPKPAGLACGYWHSGHLALYPVLPGSCLYELAVRLLLPCEGSWP